MTLPQTDRRGFIKQAAAVSSAAVLGAPNFLRARNANEKLNIALIGVGGRGQANIKQLAMENIVALCDVNLDPVEKTGQTYPKARKLQDFRKLFDHEKEFDAVVVSTCEHTHAFATLAALQLNKHVYCEKPLTYNISEARIIREFAAKTKVATQMGNQNHANDNFRRVIELVQGGVIGPVREVHVWVSRAWGMQSEEEAKANKDILIHSEWPSKADPIPANFNFELWLGPAPARGYAAACVAGPKWYRYWDFGNGTMSDLGSHWNDLPFWALKLKAPKTIEAVGPKAHPDVAPASMQAIYEFPARDDMPAVKMTWHQGTYKPKQFTDKTIPQWGNGMLFIGDKGMILSDYTKHVLLPEKQFEGLKPPEQTMAKSAGHWLEWVNACKTGSPTMSNFQYAGLLTESNHLGNVAYRVGKKLEWDPVAMKATNCPEADKFIHREYRKGWKLA